MNTKPIIMKVMGVMLFSFLILPVGLAAVIWLLDGSTRGAFDDAKIISVRYFVTVFIQMALMIPFFIVASKRKPGAPLTWGEAMVASLYVFFVLFWAYGVLPHEYLNWADSELSWRPDKLLLGPGGQWSEIWSGLDSFPITIHKQILRDIVAVVIYVVGLGGFIWATAFWNDREKMIKEADAIEPRSTFGRPLVAKVKG